MRDRKKAQKILRREKTVTRIEEQKTKRKARWKSLFDLKREING